MGWAIGHNLTLTRFAQPTLSTVYSNFHSCTSQVRLPHMLTV